MASSKDTRDANPGTLFVKQRTSDYSPGKYLFEYRQGFTTVLFKSAVRFKSAVSIKTYS